MKKLALVSAIALSGLIYNNANAQILQIGLNLGGHRPVIEAALSTPNVAINYSNADDYYYLPDVDAYYSVPDQMYYYNNGENWVPAAYLPGEYRDYDWRAARHYEIRGRCPFLNADVYRERYNGRAYDWRRYNDRPEVRRDERFDRKDDRFDNRRDDRFNNRQDNRFNEQRDFNNRNDIRQQAPQFVRPNDQPRGAEHAQGMWNNNGGNRDQNNQGNRGNNNNGGNRNDNRGQSNDQPQHQNSNNGQQQHQRSDDHFAGNREQGGNRGFGRS